MSKQSFEQRLKNAERAAIAATDLHVSIPGEPGGDGIIEGPGYFVPNLIDRLEAAMDGSIELTQDHRLAVVAIVNMAFSEAYSRGGIEFAEMQPGSATNMQRKITVDLPRRPYSVETAHVEAYNYNSGGHND
jgi:hypothetical protein